MLKKLPVQSHLEMFKTVHTSFIHNEHELCLLLVKDVERGLDDIDRLNCYDEQLWLYYRVLGLKSNDNNKVYSFHAPEVK